MPKTKGTDIGGLKKVLQDRGMEASFLSKLTPELAKLYRDILPFSWTPVERQTEIYVAAAATLFPEKSEPMRELGRALAQHTYSGIYKIFLRIPSTEFVMSRTAQLWQTYYDSGEAVVENFTGHHGTLVVRKFPELPRKMREVICGHLEVLVEATGSKRVTVQLQDQDPNAWRWEIDFS
jgi:Protein of unknown function (DUF2378)